MAKVYAGDIGTLIRLDVGTDVTGSVVEIRVDFEGSSLTWAATANGNFVEYVTKGDATDIASAGKYKLQAHVNKGAWIGLGETVTLKVYGAFR